jgi:hypothetical protein
VGQIVQKGGQSRNTEPGAVYPTCLLRIAVGCINDSLRRLQRAERVLQTRVHRAAKYEMGGTELTYAPEPLELRRVNDVDLRTVDVDRSRMSDGEGLCRRIRPVRGASWKLSFVIFETDHC